MTPFRTLRTPCVVLFAVVAAAISSPAQTFTNLATFDITDGAYPTALVQAPDGNFYGTTLGGGIGGVGGWGTIFKITPSGNLTTVVKFDGTDGGGPQGLVLAANGDFYGLTYFADGSHTTFFELKSGSLTTLSTGIGSPAGLIQDYVDGNFYGTAPPGGVYGGAVFALTPGGAASTLHTFCQTKGCPDGNDPVVGLIQGADRFLYGTTLSGGSNPLCEDNIGCGTFFKIGTAGHLTTFDVFNSTDGEGPTSALIQATDGNFYGTSGGGKNGRGQIYKITPEGSLTSLYSFSGIGGPSHAALIQGTDGNFYGTTPGIGAGGECSGSNCGMIFQLTPGGTFTVLHEFTKTDGMNPLVGLVQGTDGSFYGTTNGFNGQHLYGTVFRLSLGLAPFVKTVPAAAYTGAQIFILGTDLNGATKVTFNGKVAAFTVVSPTEISATVPGSATTGTVEVTTPTGTLSSNVVFLVL